MKKSKQIDFPIPPEAAELAGSLSDVELAFAHHVLNGLSQAEAYRRTHRKSSDDAARAGGYRIAGRKQVAAYLRTVRKASWREAWLSFEESRALLAEIARDGSLSTRERVTALALDAKMGGYFDRPPDEGDDEEGIRVFERLAAQIKPSLDLPGASPSVE